MKKHPESTATCMLTDSGLGAANQIILSEPTTGKRTFLSYGTQIAVITDDNVTLDKKYWDYSTTTTRYLCRFLGLSSKKEIEKRISSNEYKLKDLNNVNK